MMGASILPAELSRRLFDEALLAAEVGAVGLDLKRLAQDAQRAVVGVQRAADERRHETLGVVLAEGVLDDALAGAGLADDEAEASQGRAIPLSARAPREFA